MDVVDIKPSYAIPALLSSSIQCRSRNRDVRAVDIWKAELSEAEAVGGTETRGSWVDSLAAAC